MTGKEETRGGGTRIWQLKTALGKCKQGKTETIAAYYGRISKLWEELSTLMAVPICECKGCTCGVADKIQKLMLEDRLHWFLLGLNPSFESVGSQLVKEEPLPSIDQAYQNLVLEEKLRTTQEESAASSSGTKKHPTQEESGLTSLTPDQWTSAVEKFMIVRSIGEECIQDKELIKLLAKKPQPICYDGFEPSGRMHIAQGVMKTINVNKLTSAGCKVKILIADLFALLNNKMNGDLNKIELVGKSMIEIWKAMGMNLDQVEFLWSSKEINSSTLEYLLLVIDIARKNSIQRVKRCCQIMGRTEGDDMPAAQILYPLMQCADIFFLKADICQLGMDQRKVNVLAREYCDVIKRKNKPIILSHHMLPGLKGQPKMSKSDPDSSIFMDDDEKLVRKKINGAACPPNIVEGNPCLEYIKYIVFPWFNEFKVDRSDEHGGNKIYMSIEELNADYESGQLHPADLKHSLSNALNKILQPVRDHIENDPVAKDLCSRVKEFKNSK